MSYKVEQLVRTSSGKTGIIKKSEGWEVDGYIYHDSKVARMYGTPSYVPYQVQLGSKVFPIGHKFLEPVERVGISVNVTDYQKVSDLLKAVGIDYNFV